MTNIAQVVTELQERFGNNPEFVPGEDIDPKARIEVVEPTSGQELVVGYGKLNEREGYRLGALLDYNLDLVNRTRFFEDADVRDYLDAQQMVKGLDRDDFRISVISSLRSGEGRSSNGGSSYARNALGQRAVGTDY